MRSLLIAEPIGSDLEQTPKYLKPAQVQSAKR